MKRIEQKVKDLIEVRSYLSNYDFAKEPAKALTSYHFTDITSDLMAKWLGKVGHVVEGNGAAFALAGFRGVGKSHFLTALGAIVGNADLRSRISDHHVDAAAHALARRKFDLGWVRRGSELTLLDEVKTAIAGVTGNDKENLSGTLTEIFEYAISRSTDTPLILLIDTSLERSERVARDDGGVLGEIGDLAKRLGFFVGIALDDDIAGADGANSAIAKSYSIDYLDHEHLYKIVDSHIFPKNQRTQPILREIYEYYRAVVPGFRWAEPRFSALYPLHPAIMEIAPFVRLYLQEFALLGFAAEAGTRILGRPANSLIAPDEVFDNVETQLRNVEQLAAAFEVFDRLNRDVVSKTPVVKRLQAKLILKGLLLFSLNDETSTASEIGASMLIFDEADPELAIREIESVLQAFAMAAPDGIRSTADETGKFRYGFRLDSKDDLKIALQTAATNVTDADLDLLMRRLMAERFPDCNFPHDAAGEPGNAAESHLLWRGGVRKGIVLWELSGTADERHRGGDWSVSIVKPQTDLAAFGDTAVGWQPAPLSRDDRDLLARYWLLQNDGELRAEYSDHLASSVQTHAAAAAKLFQRKFLDEGVITIGGFEYNLTEESRSAATLTQLFTAMLEPLFEGRFPEHPHFPHVLGMQEVASIASGFFSGSQPTSEEMQRLASSYCVPLNIAFDTGSGVAATTPAELAQLSAVTQTMHAVEGSGAGSAPLAAIRQMLCMPPYGLVSESVYLVLTAMVAARMIEFVTERGDRINHRSLDLKIIWNDISAVAKPADAGYSADRLMYWASALTDIEKRPTLTADADREAVLNALDEWKRSWSRRAVGTRFAEVDDCLLTTKVWRAAFSIKPFDSVALTIDSVTAQTLTLEEGLGRIADAFSDSGSEFERRKNDIASVDEFLNLNELRQRSIGYVSRCEMTGDDEIDLLRTQVWDLAIAEGDERSEETDRDLANLWSRFVKQYTMRYIDRHNSSQSSADVREKLVQMQKTDVWWEFDSISSSRVFDAEMMQSVRRSLGELKRLDCTFDTAESLRTSPVCGCGFTFELGDELEEKPAELWREINLSLQKLRDDLLNRRSDIEMLRNHGFPMSAINSLLNLLGNPSDQRRFTEIELNLIKALANVTEGIPAPSAVPYTPVATVPATAPAVAAAPVADHSEYESLVRSLEQ